MEPDGLPAAMGLIPQETKSEFVTVIEERAILVDLLGTGAQVCLDAGAHQEVKRIWHVGYNLQNVLQFIAKNYIPLAGFLQSIANLPTAPSPVTAIAVSSLYGTRESSLFLLWCHGLRRCI